MTPATSLSSPKGFSFSLSTVHTSGAGSGCQIVKSLCYGGKRGSFSSKAKSEESAQPACGKAQLDDQPMRTRFENVNRKTTLFRLPVLSILLLLYSVHNVQNNCIPTISIISYRVR